MGASPSSRKSKLLHGSASEVVKLMMPIYYSAEHKLSGEETAVAKTTWDLIVKDRSPEFLAHIGKADFQYQSCVSFFYDTFYGRLFDVHPLCRQLFMHGTNNQGKFLVKMIGLALSKIRREEDADEFDKTLHQLAKVHFERGVKAVEYGIVGEVLFWSLKTVLGETIYTQHVHQIWVKVYNRMIRIIVPSAVSLEIRKTHQKPNMTIARDSSFFNYNESMMWRDPKIEEQVYYKLSVDEIECCTGHNKAISSSEHHYHSYHYHYHSHHVHDDELLSSPIRSSEEPFSPQQQQQQLQEAETTTAEAIFMEHNNNNNSNMMQEEDETCLLLQPPWCCDSSQSGKLFHSEKQQNNNNNSNNSSPSYHVISYA